jgi:hypothetical protein
MYIHASANSGRSSTPHLCLALRPQPAFDILLHKASDELVEGGAAQPAFSARLQAVQQYVAQQPHICVVDPFDAVTAVLDRGSMCRLLEGLAGLELQGGQEGPGAAAAAAGGASAPQGQQQAAQAQQPGQTGTGGARVRGPGFLLVESFDEPGLVDRLAAAGGHMQACGLWPWPALGPA